MSRITDLIDTFRQVKDLLPVVLEIIECFKGLQLQDQKTFLRIIGKKLDNETVKTLAMIAGVPEALEA